MNSLPSKLELDVCRGGAEYGGVGPVIPFVTVRHTDVQEGLRQKPYSTRARDQWPGTTSRVTGGTRTTQGFFTTQQSFRDSAEL
jgi:hypothetical protein